jgi:hypothetical protein
MSQSDREKSNPRNAPTSEQKKLDLPITGVSPDDPFPVDPGGTTGKPGQQEK